MKLSLSSQIIALGLAVGMSALTISACSLKKKDDDAAPIPASTSITRVLMVSVDGMRQFDYNWFITNYPTSTLATLAAQGVVYKNAYCPFPSDSYPGLMAMITGGTPKTTGIYYDHAFESTLYSSPTSALGLHEILYDESLTDATGLTIDPAYLPTTGAAGAGTKVYPHSFLKVNTIFEVLHATGAVTAWSDKHPAYDIVNGPSGTGVTDLYCPEIRTYPGSTLDNTATVPLCMTYDDGKVTAIINQIDGKKSTGGTAQAVPVVFGMNFQAVSVAQKITKSGTNPGSGVGTSGGYTSSTPTVPGGVLTPNTDTLAALVHTDASIGRLVAELKAKDLWASTLLIISAKHGQGGLDPATVVKIAESNIISPVQGVDPNATFSDDDVGIVWLNDKTKLTAAVAALQANTTLMPTVSKILSTSEIAARFGTTYPTRLPDIVIISKPGVLYSTSSKKNSDHGGDAEDDRHVICLVANPSLIPNTITDMVATTQIAPTILQQLGQNPALLQSVVAESTTVLPGILYSSGVARPITYSSVFMPSGSN